jgi:dephospho-CoA kinase
MDRFRAFCPDLVSFKADEAVRRLLSEDSAIQSGIRDLFGAEVMTAAGRVDRAYLRAKVFADPELRRKLEGLIHPRVREECLDLLGQACTVGAPLFLAEIPLLFEGGFHFGQELNLLVAVSRDTQVARLRIRDGFDEAMATRILEAQWPMDEKLLKADVVFWNEGPASCLDSQIQRFLHSTQI